MERLQVHGVKIRVDGGSQDVIVLLTDVARERALPIVVGTQEGLAIATAHAGRTAPRPGTHDLLLAALAATGVELDCVEIVRLDEGVFHASLVLSNGEQVDARASDVVALALRADVTIWCAQDVLAEAAVPFHRIPSSESVDEDPDESDSEATVDAFRAFLEEIEPEDFQES